MRSRRLFLHSLLAATRAVPVGCTVSVRFAVSVRRAVAAAALVAIAVFAAPPAAGQQAAATPGRAAAAPLVAPRQVVSPGQVATGIFGLEARGNRFVYVFDRSASMAEPDGRPLARAKAELLWSIEQLGDVQQFYVIFYNDRMHLFTAAAARGRLVFATEENKRSARRFIEAVRADGGTRHAEPLLAALRLAPDAIFMLTDGEEADDLTEDELRRIRGSLGRTRCMIVQFGGDGVDRSPRLARLAAESGGEYRVVDAAGGD